MQFKKKSNYFHFNELLNSKDCNFFEYRGWNGLSVIKLDIFKEKTLSESFINSRYIDLVEKEKIFVLTKGKMEIKSEERKVLLKEYDAVNFFSKSQKYKMHCLEDTTIFMISAKDLENSVGEPIFFNFKKDIEAKNLWGGQIISRPYEGRGLTLVLFDLKNGFKFEDKGHDNEQITWLISGKMDFYADGNYKTLKPNIGVDIGPNHVHGGVSGGAIGFDAFFPKRQEVKYKN